MGKEGYIDYFKKVKNRCLLLWSMYFFCGIQLHGQIDTTDIPVLELSSCYSEWFFINDNIGIYRDRTRKMTFEEARERRLLRSMSPMSLSFMNPMTPITGLEWRFVMT